MFAYPSKRIRRRHILASSGLFLGASCVSFNASAHDVDADEEAASRAVFATFARKKVLKASFYLGAAQGFACASDPALRARLSEIADDKLRHLAALGIGAPTAASPLTGTAATLLWAAWRLEREAAPWPAESAPWAGMVRGARADALYHAGLVQTLLRERGIDAPAGV